MRFDIPDDKKLVYEMLIPIRWGDMDAMGHVNNAVYFRYMETLRIDWFQHIGVRPEGADLGPIIVNAFCNFIKPLAYPGDLLARHYVAAIGRSTIDTYATLERVDQPGVIHSTGGATVVWSDFKAQKSVPLPDHIRALLG